MVNCLVGDLLNWGIWGFGVRALGVYFSFIPITNTKGKHPKSPNPPITKPQKKAISAPLRVF
jgi:hypothetical protein